MKTAKNPADGLRKLRRLTRDALHQQLDAMLEGPSTMPDGSQGTVIEDIVARQLVGFGFSVSISVRHPDAPGRATEDPSTTEALSHPQSRILTRE